MKRGRNEYVKKLRSYSKKQKIDSVKFHENPVKVFRLAVEAGDVEKVKFALDHGINPNIFVRSAKNWTALHVLPRYKTGANYFKIFDMLLQHPSIDVNSKTTENWTPLHLASRNAGATSSNYARALLRHPNIQINILNCHNFTPLMLAARHTDETNCKEIFDLLIADPRCEVNGRSRINKHTTLHCCAFSKDPKAIFPAMKALLVQPKIDPFLKCSSGKTFEQYLPTEALRLSAMLALTSSAFPGIPRNIRRLIFLRARSLEILEIVDFTLASSKLLQILFLLGVPSHLVTGWRKTKTRLGLSKLVDEILSLGTTFNEQTLEILRRRNIANRARYYLYQAHQLATTLGLRPSENLQNELLEFTR